MKRDIDREVAGTFCDDRARINFIKQENFASWDPYKKTIYFSFIL